MVLLENSLEGLSNNVIVDSIQITKEESDSLHGRQSSKNWYQYDRRVVFLFGGGASTNCIFCAAIPMQWQPFYTNCGDEFLFVLLRLVTHLKNA